MLASGYLHVSVIMPVRNEVEFIRLSLSAVLAQDYPEECLEIIVADGMSTDGTREIVQFFQSNRPHMKLIDNHSQIVATGLNSAIARSGGEIVIRVDGHCEITPDYVRRCVQHIYENEVDAVGGPIETVGSTPLAQTIAIAMSTPFGVGNSAFRTVNDKEMLVDTVAFPAYTRHALQLAGPFDEELVRNQDDEYNYRLSDLGVKILLAPDVKSKYYSRSSLSSLWRQYWQYGFWKVRVLQKHPRQMHLRQFAPPLFVASLLSAALLAPFTLAGQVALAAILGLYLIANLTASLYVTRRHGWRHLPLLPVVFAILHLAYGSGFLIGLLKFFNRWGDKVGKVPPWSAINAPVD